MTTTLDQNALPELDGLLADLKNSSDTGCELVREHLECARAYLMGAMPEEYQLNLQLAETQAKTLTDDGLRKRISKFSESQLSGKNNSAY